jgi:hypothetical protein
LRDLFKTDAFMHEDVTGGIRAPTFPTAYQADIGRRSFFLGYLPVTLRKIALSVCRSATLVEISDF